LDQLERLALLEFLVRLAQSARLARLVQLEWRAPLERVVSREPQALLVHLFQLLVPLKIQALILRLL
jgi:hypothetical protein